MATVRENAERIFARDVKPGQIIIDHSTHYKAWKVIPVEKHGGFVLTASRRDRRGVWDHEPVALLFGSAEATVLVVTP